MINRKKPTTFHAKTIYLVISQRTKLPLRCFTTKRSANAYRGRLQKLGTLTFVDPLYLHPSIKGLV